MKLKREQQKRLVYLCENYVKEARKDGEANEAAQALADFAVEVFLGFPVYAGLPTLTALIETHHGVLKAIDSDPSVLAPLPARLRETLTSTGLLNSEGALTPDARNGLAARKRR